MRFICLNLKCGAGISFKDIKEPEKWETRHNYALVNEYSFRCPQCGAGMAAESFILHFGKGKMLFDARVYKAFSRCPNAHECWTFNVYSSDCEDAVHIKPKCLYALHAAVQRLEYRLDDVEKLFPQGRGKLIPLSKALKK